MTQLKTDKLFKVTLRHAAFLCDESPQIFYIHAPNHKVAADAAFQQWKHPELEATVSDVAYMEIEQSGTTTTTRLFDGDGVKVFKGFTTKIQHQFYQAQTSFFPVLFAIVFTFLCCAALWGGR